MHQLSLFGDLKLEERPEQCSVCGGKLYLVHPSFTRTSGYRGFYEASCEACRSTFRLYRNCEGNPDWKLIRHEDDPSWG